MRIPFRRIPLLLLLACAAATASAADAAPLHERIDALIDAGAKDYAIATPADDGEFLRRVTLDFRGTIPTAAEARAFFADPSPDKRSKFIDALIESDTFAPRLAEMFHIMFMERRGDDPAWQQYLFSSFKANKPADQLARDILNPNPRDESARGAAFFLSKRLEKYGENPTDYPGLTRDVGRLFLGVDLQCAQCHNHLTVRDYKQVDFQGLFAVFSNLTQHGGPSFPAVSEKVMTKKTEFASVFNKQPKATGPRLPGLGTEEIAIVTFEKGKELAQPADAKEKLPAVPAFSPLAELAKRLPAPQNKAFARNMVNRLWFVLMGRGLVHPLDLHHSDNPPSHPELLNLLADEFVAHKHDMKWLLRELVMTRAYERSSQSDSDGASAGKAPPEDRFAVALERRLSWEQLLRATLTALGEKETPELRKRYEQAFVGEPKEPEQAVEPSLKAALFLRNDAVLLKLLEPREGNLVGRLVKEKDDAKLAEELYLSVLTRVPNEEERREIVAYLAKHGEKRAEAVGDLVWALLASIEFGVNH